ncbi:hypothetical protein PIB30_069073, partial [Stylosanthes scabra]|nr:hypothetical protein [Stylosanthes scabra]
DGTILCAIKPIYGTGKEAGNEEGYAVGMSGCYPKPGSVKIKDEEVLVAEFVHQNKFSTRLMGHFYVYLAKDLPEYVSKILSDTNVKQDKSSLKCAKFDLMYVIE